MLTGAAADFQHARPIRELHAQHAQDRITIAIARRSVGFSDHVLAKLGCNNN
jgi:hypothetical protein